MSKRNILHIFKQMLGWISLNITWSISIGILLPRMPFWGIPVLMIVIGLLLSLIWVQLVQLAQKKELTWFKKPDGKAWIPGILGVVILVRAFAYKLSAFLPDVFYEFILLSIFFGWGWYEIILRTSKKLLRYYVPTSALFRGVGFSLVGICLGSLIHFSMEGKTFLPLVVSFLYSCTYILGKELTRELQRQKS